MNLVNKLESIVYEYDYCCQSRERLIDLILKAFEESLPHNMATRNGGEYNSGWHDGFDKCLSTIRSGLKAKGTNDDK